MRTCTQCKFSANYSRAPRARPPPRACLKPPSCCALIGHRQVLAGYWATLFGRKAGIEAAAGPSATIQCPSRHSEDKVAEHRSRAKAGGAPCSAVPKSSFHGLVILQSGWYYGHHHRSGDSAELTFIFPRQQTASRAVVPQDNATIHHRVKPKNWV